MTTIALPCIQCGTHHAEVLRGFKGEFFCSLRCAAEWAFDCIHAAPEMFVRCQKCGQAWSMAGDNVCEGCDKVKPKQEHKPANNREPLPVRNGYKCPFCARKAFLHYGYAKRHIEMMHARATA